VSVEWDDLRFLLAVCECGSASSAARKLTVDKATVVRRVSRLEQVLGVRLLIRKASGWSPTPAGRLTAAAARRINGEIIAVRSEFSDAQGAPRTQVSVTAPHWFCSELLLPELPRLIRDAPWIDLTVAATSRVLDLAQREADVAVRNSRPEVGDFVVRRAGELGSTLYASRAYAKKHPRSTAPPGWSSHRFVGYADRLTYVPAFAWLDEAAGSGAGVTRADDAGTIRSAITAGLGVGVLPCVLGDRAPELVRFGEEVSREGIWLVSPNEAAGTRAVKLALSFVADVFKRNARALAG
jgi:DNA-binding transcriptional LysR family regulator